MRADYQSSSQLNDTEWAIIQMKLPLVLLGCFFTIELSEAAVIATIYQLLGESVLHQFLIPVRSG